ncbi:hypothetical protein [Chlamydiifrater phoenicopteri]|uniref:hypothetical protein n=1 Tax=Chlamydiifrater phoenicopteri TaxID=2681469 RepID=UPI001BD0B9F8|nr:hypothetical protein [Chlamydiifrater phoenicopteri]
MVEQWLSSNLKTTVTVGRVSLGLSTFKIRNLRIHNSVSDEKFPYMLESEQIFMKFSLPTMLLSKKIEISEIIVKGSTLSLFSYSQDVRANNLSLFLVNLDGGHSQNKKSSTFNPEYNTSLISQRQPPVFIKRCLFFNTRCYSTINSNKELSINAVPSMEFHGKTDSVPTPQQAIKSLLCLSIEECCLHLGVKLTPSQTLLNQSLAFFGSNLPLLETVANRKDSQSLFPSSKDLPNLLRDLLSR